MAALVSMNEVGMEVRRTDPAPSPRLTYPCSLAGLKQPECHRVRRPSPQVSLRPPTLQNLSPVSPATLALLPRPRHSNNYTLVVNLRVRDLGLFQTGQARHDDCL